MRRTSGTFGPVFLSKIVTSLLNRSIKLMIISHIIKFGSRKRMINVKNTFFYRTVEQRTPNVFLCPLSNAMCDSSE